MVEALRRGASQRTVAREFGVSLLTVQRWAKRAGGRLLDEIDWRDRPAGPHQAPKRTPQEIEDMVLRLRQELRQESDLGEYGGRALPADNIMLPFVNMGVSAVSAGTKVRDRGAGAAEDVDDRQHAAIPRRAGRAREARSVSDTGSQPSGTQSVAAMRNSLAQRPGIGRRRHGICRCETRVGYPGIEVNG